jgi:xanthine dehydrogenase small subunit
MALVAEPRVESPRDLAGAYALLADADGPPWRPVAGGTDLMVQLAAGSDDAPTRVVDLWGLDELRGIAVEDDALVLGALTTYTELRRSPLVTEFLPTLAEAAATVGAAQIQNRGTIGGNVVNASPAGDTLPLLLATDASLELGSTEGMHAVPADAFWTGYRQTACRDHELLLRIRIPLRPDRQVRFRKVGTRRAQAISKVVAAVAWRGEDPDQPWADVRVALGSVAATTVRLPATEAVLEDAPPTRETAEAAATTVAREIEPIDDVRSTADYRRAVAARVLHRIIRDAGAW